MQRTSLCCTQVGSMTRSSFAATLILGAYMCSSRVGQAQNRGSLAGEEAAQALKRSISAEDYNLKYGPVRFQTEATLAAGYTDNVFYSEKNRRNDFLLNPEVDLRA